MPNAPYSLVSVSVEQRGGKMSSSNPKRSSSKRDKRKAEDDNEGEGISVVIASEPPTDVQVGKSAKPKLDIAALKPLPSKPAKLDVPKETPTPAPQPPGPLVQQGSGADRPKFGLHLDLSKTKEIPREQTEQQLRVEKLKRYESECTKITDFMFVGGVKVAENKELLTGMGITHIINCAGITSEDFFPESFTYKTLYINDEPSEDIIPHLYDVLDFVDEVRRGGNKVLVHCTQGVSRSCTLCIAYLMLTERISYEDGFMKVKAHRGICNPNAGFSSQLVLWGRRIGLGGQKQVRRPRGFVIEKYNVGTYGCEKAGLVARAIDESRYNVDNSKVYIMDAAGGLWIWIGSRADKDGEAVMIAKRAARKLQEHEGAHDTLELVHQGSEPQDLLLAVSTMCFQMPASQEAMDIDKHQPHAHEAAQQSRAAPEVSHEGSHEKPQQKLAFPQGGIACEVQTPRGERPPLPSLGGLQLKAPPLNVVKAEAQAQQAGWGPSRDERNRDDDEGSDEGSGGGAAMRLFQAPDWDEIENFDSDDLWSDKAFILIEKSSDPKTAHVWIGSEFAGLKGDDADEYAEKAAQALTKHKGIQVSDTKAIEEGEEPDNFWDFFSLG